jgi:hypothetical protein
MTEMLAKVPGFRRIKRRFEEEQESWGPTRTGSGRNPCPSARVR